MKLQQSYINQTRENKAKPNSDYDNCFEQGETLKINNKQSFAVQTLKKEKTGAQPHDMGRAPWH